MNSRVFHAADLHGSLLALRYRVADRDRRNKLADPEGLLGTTSRYWLNHTLPGILRRYVSSDLVLDIGCGDGTYSALVADSLPHARYVGLDRTRSICWPVLQRAAGSGNSHVDFLCGDAQSLPFCEGRISSIVSLTAFEHVADDERAIREVARVLSPGGMAIIVVPTSAGRFIWGPRHGRWYSPADANRLASASRLRLTYRAAGGGLASTIINSVWWLWSVGVTGIVAVPLLIWCRGDRRRLARRFPFVRGVGERARYWHLKFRLGRVAHAAMNRALLFLDERLRWLPSLMLLVYSQPDSRGNEGGDRVA